MAFKHYDVVRAASPSDLAERITQKLKEGWQPYGSALISTAGYGAEFIQPVVSEGSISSPEEPGNRPTTSATFCCARILLCDRACWSVQWYVIR